MIFRYIDKVTKLVAYKIAFLFSWLITYCKFKLNGIVFCNDYVARGIPLINVNLRGSFSIGRGFMMHSGLYFNMVGRQQRCIFIVGPGAHLTIGDNVGMSSTALVCHDAITIENNVRIGGGVVIYDTDFHSLHVAHRLEKPEKAEAIKKAPVTVGENAFIGAHAIILKGVTIGRNAIVGAGAVVAKSIPEGQIWAGNPAKFVRNND